MSRTSIATPCPAPSGLSSLPLPVQNRRLSSASIASGQDDAAELDYTRAISLEYKNAQPRRRSTFYKRAQKEAAVTIFEDVIEDEELVVQNKGHIGGTTLLGKPAQKIRGYGQRKREKDGSQVKSEPLPVIAEARRRSSIQPQALFSEVGQDEKQFRQQENGLAINNKERVRSSLLKEPRRRTIFIPTEDTTILTIHPGANTTTRLDDTFQLHNTESEQYPAPCGDGEIPQQRKKLRMSLAAAPKRIPLQQMANRENDASVIDVPGRNGGKENVPPHDEERKEKKEDRPLHSQKTAHQMGISKLFEPTAASRARQSVVTRKAAPLLNVSHGTKQQREARPQSSPQTRKAQPGFRVNEHFRTPPTHHERNDEGISEWRLSESGGLQRASLESRPRPNERRIETKTARLQQYPILSENLAQPELYEDNWLSHQEVALTELVNQILSSDKLELKQRPRGNGSLREQMIQIYHQPKVTALHRRLKASLSYGALSRPKDAASPPNPAQDIGLRKRFINLWLESYHTASLRVAAEVVFGRQLPEKTSPSGGFSDSTLDPHKNRRALIGFLETFLVEVDNIEEPDEERGDEPNAHWRKMVLRSLSLIWLLDQAKENRLIHGCLFKTKSLHKNSTAMLYAIAAELIPSVGEITRVLRHLDYSVSHTQDPLEEVNYRISNIAVDLRDGILLTRLVEVLIFTSNRMKHIDSGGDATITIRLPDLTILESGLHDINNNICPHILSRHLKMPCLGRAQKNFNVQVAMSALRSHGRPESYISEVTADDIVDGHREKTLSLLWALVSNHGLGQLVDFKELTADIRHISGAMYDLSKATMGRDCLSQPEQESLLKKWATAYAVQQGIRISNLTTSFADGSVYAAILECFADYIQTGSKSSGSTLNDTRLEARLNALGCSEAFIKQLGSVNDTIPSRRTTISNLAFLASRLLPLARQHKAARIIQRMFRLRHSRLIISQRTTLRRLAHACATIVQTQQRLVSAATVLQRAWREVLDARIRRLNRDVELFQAVAKSWSLRRRLQTDMSREISSARCFRVMGGW